jgi:hypothetical protein
MANAPNILTLLHCFVIFLLPAPVDLLQEFFILGELMLLGLGANWVLGGLDHFSQFDRGPEPSLRCFLRQQHHLRPKYQYRYHWFKSRMKRKKKRKFRKLPSLFHLTWKYKFLLLTIWTIKILLTVGCRVEPFVRRAFGVLVQISSSLCTNIPSQAIKVLHLRMPRK